MNQEAETATVAAERGGGGSSAERPRLAMRNVVQHLPGRPSRR